MMPSAQKQNQAQTTNTSTVGQNPAADSRFTRAEIGQQGLVRSIDRKLSEMNSKKSEIATAPVIEAPLYEPVVADGDRAFPSTSDLNQVPSNVIALLRFHEIDPGSVIRIVHIPGANYFTAVQMNGDQKKYTTFSLDEVIEEPESESTGTPEEPEPIPEATMDSETLPPVIGEVQAPTTNTLGTIGREPVIMPPINPEPAEPKVVIEAVFPDTEKIEQKVQQVSPQQMLDQKRSAMAREFGPYIANHYHDVPSGSFSGLFGTNTQVQDQIFKTVREYLSAKKEYLQSTIQDHSGLSEMIQWVRNEYNQISLLLSHDRLHIFKQLAQLFQITAPGTIETKNRVIATALPVSPRSPIAERLGIRGVHQTPHSWEIIFSQPQQKSFPESRLLIQVQNRESNQVVTEPVEPIVAHERRDNRQLYDKLFDLLKQWLVASVVFPSPIISVQNSEVVTSVTTNGKQHPEQLFA